MKAGSTADRSIVTVFDCPFMAAGKVQQQA